MIVKKDKESMERKIGKIFYFLFLSVLIPQVFAQVEIYREDTSSYEDDYIDIHFEITYEQSVGDIFFDLKNLKKGPILGETISQQVSSVNGEVTRKVIKKFTFAALREGSASLKNIKVQIDGSLVEVEDFVFEIKKQAAQERRFYIEAEIKKNEIYLGEKLDIDYYIYSKSDVSGFDLKKYPRLKGFSKRLLKGSKRKRVVTKKGIRYYKIHIFSFRTYPLKNEDLEIDPIEVDLKYYESTQNSISGFFFGTMSKLKTKRLKSKSKRIKIISLPEFKEEGINTKLVGKHDVQFFLNKNKFIANEPIEIKVVLHGEGRVEFYKLPPLFNSSEIEEFSAESQTEHLKPKSIKKYEYVFLPRNAQKMEAITYKFWFFDPLKKEYYFKEMIIPSIEVIAAISSGEGYNVLNNSDISFSPPSFKLKNNIVIFFFHLLLIVLIFYFLFDVEIIEWRQNGNKRRKIVKEIWNSSNREKSFYKFMVQELSRLEKGKKQEKVKKEIDELQESFYSAKGIKNSSHLKKTIKKVVGYFY